MDYAENKQRAHMMIDHLAPEQIEAAVGILDGLLDPVSRMLVNAPYEDELISEEEELAAAASKEWLKTNEGIPMEVVLAEFGLTMADFRRMSETSVENNGSGQ